VERVYQLAAEPWNAPYITVVPPFFDDPRFIDAFAAVAHDHLDAQRPDQVLMSFHGLPERHVTKSDPTGKHCLQSETCCDALVDANRNCYRAQCFATARALARRLDIEDDRYQVTFQSRLGRNPWIQPHTDATIESLAKGGTKRLAVLCPAFVADCLETLEEIGMGGKEAFEAAGGESLALIPCLNSHPAWIDAVVSLVRDVLAAPIADPSTQAAVAEAPRSAGNE
jgi:ferrochelatase